MSRALLAANLATALLLTGLIWTIQLVHYPLFEKADRVRFTDFEAEHSMRITWLVGPLMLAELAASVLLVVRRPDTMPPLVTWILLALLAVVWASTFFLQVPRHAELAQGFSSAAHQSLVASNWIRTAAWSARSAILLVYCVR
jgi:hypothetical protein